FAGKYPGLLSSACLPPSASRVLDCKVSWHLSLLCRLAHFLGEFFGDTLVFGPTDDANLFPAKKRSTVVLPWEGYLAIRLRCGRPGQYYTSSLDLEEKRRSHKDEGSIMKGRATDTQEFMAQQSSVIAIDHGEVPINALGRKNYLGISGVNIPRCDEDRLELKELTVLLLPSDEKVEVEVSAVDLQVSAVRLMLLLLVQKFLLFEGVECLPNEEIFAELATIGYEKPSTKLTFYKAFFSSQWKFLIHTILQFMSAKITLWNEFSSSMASAVICLSSGDAKVHGEEVNDGDAAKGDVSAANDEVPTVAKEPSIPSPTSPTPPPQPSQDIPYTFQAQPTPPQSPQGRMIAEMDQDVDVVLEEAKEVADDAKDGHSANIQGRTAKSQAEIYKIDLDHANKVLSIETIITASTNITATEAQVPAVTLNAAPARVTATPSRRRKRVVIRDLQEELKSSRKLDPGVHLIHSFELFADHPRT
nr:hypothetical protein [Tanacetum cinerariifolium]